MGSDRIPIEGWISKFEKVSQNANDRFLVRMQGLALCYLSITLENANLLDHATRSTLVDMVTAYLFAEGLGNLVTGQYHYTSMHAAKYFKDLASDVKKRFSNNSEINY